MLALFSVFVLLSVVKGPVTDSSSLSPTIVSLETPGKREVMDRTDLDIVPYRLYLLTYSMEQSSS